MFDVRDLRDGQISIYVDDGTGTTAAVMQGTDTQVFNEVCSKLHNIFLRTLGNNAHFSCFINDLVSEAVVKMQVPNRITGKSKCHPSDRYHYNVGVNLAKRRLYCNYSRHLSKVMKYVEKRLQSISIYVQKSSYDTYNVYKEKELYLENLLLNWN